jgi:DNA-directed RNA polymerase subunit M/transcription elongation factor TFIIS
MSDEALIAKGLELLRKGTADIPQMQCPECGSEDITVDEHSGGMGEVLYEYCVCNACGASWKNHYEIFQQELLEGSTK